MEESILGKVRSIGMGTFINECKVIDCKFNEGENCQFKEISIIPMKDNKPFCSKYKQNSFTNASRIIVDKKIRFTPHQTTGKELNSFKLGKEYQLFRQDKLDADDQFIPDDYTKIFVDQGDIFYSVLKSIIGG
jgi:hypothetical protein